MSKVKGRLFSSFTIVFLLIFYVTESNCRANPPQSGQASVVSKFDPDEPPETIIRLAPFLMFGGQIELEYGLERNLDLNSAQDEDLSTIEPGLALAFSFEPSEYLHSFFNVKLGWELFLDEGVKKDDKAIIEVEQAYLFLKDLFGGRLSFQVGRQRYDDERQWLYDEELDAARSFYKFSEFSIELSASRKNLADRDLLNPDKGERINNYVMNGIYKHEEEERETIAAAYVFARDDRSDKEESPVFLGIHGEGDANDNLGYWLELAYVVGKEGSDKIRGFGFDLGSTYVLDLPLEPSVILGYAFGTGDGDPDDGTACHI